MLLLVFLFCFALSQNNEQLFEDFIVRFNKKYETAEIKKEKFHVFEENLKRIEELNTELSKSSFGVYGMNEFTDLSPEEFRAQKLMNPINPKETDLLLRPFYESSETFENEDIPDSWNWVDKGAVTGVKNQESCGSCWSFSTTGNIEGQNVVAGKNPLVSLSEQQLVECDNNKDCGCLGGLPWQAMQWLMENRNGQILKESVYPYCEPSIGDCYPCVYSESYCGELYYCNVTCHDSSLASIKENIGATIKNFTILPKDEEYIKSYLYEHGPLSVLIDASTLQYYHGGVWDPILCDHTSLDHAVLLVGYGTEKTVFGTKDPYWIIKNSWGSQWGEKGFFKMKRGKDKCGVAEQVVNAIM